VTYRKRAQEIIEEEEKIGADNCKLQPGYAALMTYLETHKVPKGACYPSHLLCKSFVS
jgi:hypothetical protein